MKIRTTNIFQYAYHVMIRVKEQINILILSQFSAILAVDELSPEQIVAPHLHFEESSDYAQENRDLPQVPPVCH